MKNTSVSLGSHFDSFVRAQVASGRYQTASEVIRSGLRLLELEEQKLAALRRHLAEGEASGVAEGFDMQSLLAELNRAHDAGKTDPRSGG